MADLEALRREIDAVDEEIVRAFETRIQIAEEVARCKIEKGLPVLDRKREAELLKKREEMLSNQELSSDIDRVFELLMSLSRAHQRRLVREERRPTQKGIGEVCKVGYSGIRGAYADMAQDQYFHSQAQAVSYGGFEEVFAAVEAGEVAFGVVPIENSYAGSVLQVYDLLDQYEVFIAGEQLIHIDHALLGVPGATLSDIREVYSHDQGLLQCSDFLDNYPQWRRVPYYNTAASAEYVAGAGDPSKAAIASEYAGNIYGLELLKGTVNTSGENSTRFIVIGPIKNTDENADKASLSFVLEHKPGALAHILNVFSRRELNMVKLESRPLQHRNFEYRFYVDFVGFRIGAHIEKAILEIEPYCTQMKLLGIYRNGC
ncbi:bifunctional chorismate mutase/prephenate dehydratase [Christensenella tenuis]|jgi:chorismate mutase / prephenate dehydratase|uniref:Bifunctional chorismate mutase/prephenate dehydratase n=1 Tax=Christensenella tenuis TaxID=2763033 RepID=A0ABR7EBI3_9FIRM|nr:bifunctional chorismate mutase/prephenate dehydratase [Christensenella tenuis]MBC5647018.1 chorismate mutase [Christensenella tenuis]